MESDPSLFLGASPTNTLVLKALGVSIALGGVPVLRHLNLEIRNRQRIDWRQGRVVALLGPSGIGKSTLLRILAGLERPDSGSVVLTDKCIPVSPGMVGLVAQDYPLFAHRRVLQNLTVAGRCAGLARCEAEAKANALLRGFGVHEHAYKYPVQLSGGQRQRVAIVQQFMADHQLLMASHSPVLTLSVATIYARSSARLYNSLPPRRFCWSRMILKARFR